jgi:hypothetical protein
MSLSDQRLDPVLDAVLPATILETGRRLPGQTDGAIGLAQQQCARVRRDGAAVDKGHQSAVALKRLSAYIRIRGDCRPPFSG